VKHVLFGSKGLFLGDAAADALVCYAAHVAQLHTGDSVAMRGINLDGTVVTTTFLLNAGTDLVVQTTDLQLENPDNDAAIAYIEERIKAFSLDHGFFEGFALEQDASDGDPGTRS
jgi:hypothetical protein